MPKAKTPTLDPNNNGLALDPIVDALLEHLPAPGDYWAKEDRALWLRMIELAFELIYTDEESGGGEPEQLNPAANVR
jgi:hypothetical protein